MAFFSVKEFDRFQHYKDRSPPWIKLYNELLDDYEFGLLPDASKMHLVAIWLLASRYSNRVPHDAEWISRRINATDPVDLSLLEKSGFIIIEQDRSETLAGCKQSAMPEREGETEREVDSEPIGSADPSALKDRIFGDVATWLAKRSAVTLPTVKSFLGLCIKDAGEEATLNAAIAAHKAEAPDPRAYMRAALDKGGGPNGFSMAGVFEELDDERTRTSSGEPDNLSADGDAVRQAPPH